MADFHNFYVTTRDICVHNVVPLVAIGLCFAFGAGEVVFTGLSVSLAAALGIGTVGFAFQKYQDKKKWQLLAQLKKSGGAKKPDDDKDKKKQERDKARKEHKPLNNKEAREQADKLGYQEVKEHPCGDTRGKPVFENPKGNGYISVDADGHNGGMWKVFDRVGDLLYSMDAELIIICKEYR